MTKKGLCWWVAYTHHVAAILALDTKDGPITILPDYTGVSVTEVPDFVKRAVDQARTTWEHKVIIERWTQLQALAKDKILWPFYAIPHAKLIALEGFRPCDSLWPRLGVRDDVLRRGVKNLREGKAGLLTRLFAADFTDGFTYTKRDSRAQSAVRQGPVKRGKANAKARRSSSSAPSHTETDEGMGSSLTVGNTSLFNH